MPVWTEPRADVIITGWNIAQVFHKNQLTKHFIGNVLNEGYGRVSTAIVSFNVNDVGEVRGKTKSGSTYRLIGEPGLTGNALYIYNNTFNKYNHKLLH
tara:strand:+ start:257 stop:550 length:294 start_codon:yes stop_codon:yes gene_type:complete